jgi:sugar-specific transcriptional regulator TrmB
MLYADLFTKLGLTPNEYNCYVYLLENGERPASDVSKKTKISRTNVYYLLSNLEQRQVIERLGEGRKITFRAKNPKNLEILLQRKEDEIRDARELLRAELPTLMMNHSLGFNEGGVYRFEGKEGLKRVYDELIRDRLPINVILNRALLWDFLTEHNQEHIRQRIKYRIKARSICVDYTSSKENDKAQLREVRYIDPKKLPLTVDFRMTSKKVILSTLIDGDIVGIIHTDKQIVQNFSLLFEFLWGIALEEDEWQKLQA